MRFVDVLTMRRIPHRRSSSDPNEIKMACPFCGDARLLLGVNIHTNVGHCFNSNCEWKSRHAIQGILKQLRVIETVEEDNATFVATEPVNLPKDFHVLSRNGDDMDMVAYKYLIKRGITEHQIQQHRIGVSFVGRYAYRIVFPVYAHKELKGIVARSFMNSEPRYLNSPGITSVYNLPKQPVKTVVLTEGIVKALRVAQVLDLNTTASISLLGHSLTDEHLDQLLKTKAETAVLVPDPDPVGKAGAAKVADRLCEAGLNVMVTTVPRIAVDDLPLNEVQEVLHNAEAFTVFTRNKLLSNFSRF